MNPYRRRILDTLVPWSRLVGQVDTWLDFGSGDGFFAQNIREKGLAKSVVPVDVLLRDKVILEPVLYDGHTLPYGDRSFEVSSAFDVLHHTPSPEASLREVLRCTSKYFIVKDHTYGTKVGYFTLGVLDEIGNRKFGVPSNYHYQERFAWDEVLASCGFERRIHVHPMPVHVGLLGLATNHLQFMSLWQRVR